MVVQKTPRLGLEKYTEGSDAHPNRAKFNSERDVFDALTALAGQGVTSARPLPGIVNRLFWDTTVKRLFWDDGTAWNEITTNGGGGAGKPITPGATAVEGVSERSARADHTHLLALATASTDGAMRKADKAKLDAASVVATGSTLAMRNAAGQIQVATPGSAPDATNKGYVDTQVATRAPSTHTHTVSQLTDMTSTGEAIAKTTSATAARSTLGLNNVDNTSDAAKPVSTATQTALNGKSDTGHNHSGADITSGLIDQARIANATSSLNGLMSSTDKAKLDAATAGATGGTLVERNAAGVIAVGTPTSGTHATTKTYVDAEIASRSPSDHTHAWSQISGKPTMFTPSDHTHSWGETTGKPTTFAPSSHNHSGADITTGTISAARLPSSSATAEGTMSAADKRKLDTAGPSSAASSIMMTGTDGYLNVRSDPKETYHPASKYYVDSQINTRAASNHTHTWNSVTGKPSTFAPSSHGHSWGQISGTPTILGYAQLDARYPQKSHNHWWSDITRTEAIYNTNAGWGSYRAVWVNSDGAVGYNLSSRKYKANERAYEPDARLLDVVEPKWFQYTKEIDEQGQAAPWRVNFIAEDLHDAGLTEYVSYDGNGTGVENAETINEQLIVNALWAFAKQQRDQITDLQQRLTTVEATA